MNKRKNKRVKVNFKIKTFLIFLSLTLLFWILIKMSKTYTSDVVFDLKYENLATIHTLQSEPIKEITASVSSTGFNLISYKLKNKIITVDLSKMIQDNKSKYYYLPNNHLSEFQNQLVVETKIDRFLVDSIFFNLGKNKSKKVPVELKGEVKFKLGYNFVNQILISPDTITINGPEMQLDTIYSINTEMLKLSEVSSRINKKVSLVAFNSDKISISNTEVLITAEIDKFTEGSLMLPFEIVNLPSNYRITTFPNEVEVIYQVGLSNFNKINKENTKVICDYSDSEKNSLTYLIPKLKQQSKLITSVKIVPEKVEFLIEEK